MSIKPEPLFILVIILLALVIAACAGADQGSKSLPSAKPSPPPEYADLVNPIDSNPTSIEEGKSLYQPNCASCHGEGGRGDGPVAGSLDPAPTDFRITQNKISDGYYFWRISEGGIGEPFNSSMPGWKNILSEEQIWKVIVYIRSLQDS